MNWEAIGAVGEILGAGGVLVTLVYLASQLHQAASNSWSQRLYTRAAYSQQTMILQKSPEVVAAVEKCYFSSEPLTLNDSIILETYIVSAMIDFHTEFLHFEKGLISKETWERKKSTIPYWFGADYPRFWWQQNKQGYEEPFIEEIDDMITSSSDIGTNTDEMLREINRNRKG